MIQRIRVHLTKTRKRTLIILDNCEEIEDTAETIKELSQFLEAQRQLTILATSRRPFHLGFQMEKVHEVSPLDVPNYEVSPLEKVPIPDAVELFRQAAVQSKPEFTLTERNIKAVVAICRALDGLPLALLIAASFVGNEPIDRLLRWIEENIFLDASYEYAEREWHESLNKLIGKSYELLEEVEKRLFRRLAIFPDACHIEAVAAVCNLEDLPEQIPLLAKYLKTLHKRYLIRYQDGWIKILHNTIRHYAMRKLRKEKDEEEGEAKRIVMQLIDYYAARKREYMKDGIAHWLSFEDEVQNMFAAQGYAYLIQYKYIHYNEYIVNQIRKTLGEEDYKVILRIINTIKKEGVLGLTAEEEEKIDRCIEIERKAIEEDSNFPYKDFVTLLRDKADYIQRVNVDRYFYYRDIIYYIPGNPVAFNDVISIFV